MIVCNGIVGLCLLLGGLKYKEIGFQFKGSSSLFVVLITLSTLCFILPNYTSSSLGPKFNVTQLVFVSVICILLYLSLIIFQTRTHKSYFTAIDYDATEIPNESDQEPFSIASTLIHTASLIIGLISVIGLAKLLAPSIESGINHLGYPKAVVGLIIATIVLLPEAFTAVTAAKKNRLQTSLNLALGSGAASVALTVPTVAAYSIIKNQPLTLGIDAKSTVFLLLTFLVTSLNLGAGKSTALQGAVHLIILASYFVMTMVP